MSFNKFYKTITLDLGIYGFLIFKIKNAFLENSYKMLF